MCCLPGIDEGSDAIVSHRGVLSHTNCASSINPLCASLLAMLPAGTTQFWAIARHLEPPAL